MLTALRVADWLNSIVRDVVGAILVDCAPCGRVRVLDALGPYLFAGIARRRGCSCVKVVPAVGVYALEVRAERGLPAPPIVCGVESVRLFVLGTASGLNSAE